MKYSPFYILNYMTMRIGSITQYKIGCEAYGVKVLNIFPQSVVYNYKKSMYKWYDTQYYIEYNGHIWFAETYQINTIVDERKLICRRILHMVRTIIINLMLDKKYEG